MSFLGHVIRADGLKNLTMTDRIAGTTERRRPTKMYLGRVKELIGEVTTQQFLNLMRDREQWRPISGNVVNGAPHR